jgi:phenylacetate-CoA ligase
MKSENLPFDVILSNCDREVDRSGGGGGVSSVDSVLAESSWAELQQHTFARARDQLSRVYAASTYYREKYADAGIDPTSVTTPDDWASLPFFEKDDERECQRREPPLGAHLCVHPDEVVRIHASSGTTGTPTFFAFTARDLETIDRIMGRAFYTLGIRPHHVFGLLGNLSMFVGGVPALTAASSIGAAAVPIGATAGTERTLELIQTLGVNAIGLTPSFAVYLGEQMPQLISADARSLGIELMMVGGEPGGQIEAVRRQIEDLWGCKVRDVMGIGEIAGAFWAESDDAGGMRFCASEEVHVELIDHETLRPIPWEDGAVGELVYTAVEREATPVVRFRSHDHVLVRMPNGDGPRVTTLGRTDDMLLVRGINVFPSAVRDVVASFVPETTGYMRVVLERPGPLVSPPLPVEIEVAASIAATAHDELRERITASIRSRLHFTPEVRLVPTNTLPRTALKAEYVHRAYEID